eukprot:4222045-Pleurochrysis_carterae.AAC.1
MRCTASTTCSCRKRALFIDPRMHNYNPRRPTEPLDFASGLIQALVRQGTEQTPPVCITLTLRPSKTERREKLLRCSPSLHSSVAKAHTLCPVLP